MPLVSRYAIRRWFEDVSKTPLHFTSSGDGERQVLNTCVYIYTHVHMRRVHVYTCIHVYKRIFITVYTYYYHLYFWQSFNMGWWSKFLCSFFAMDWNHHICDDFCKGQSWLKLCGQFCLRLGVLTTLDIWGYGGFHEWGTPKRIVWNGTSQ